MKKIGIIAGFILVVIAVVAVVMMNTKTTNNTPASTPATGAQTNAVEYTDTGFSPATTTVKAGTTVTFKNSSSSALQLDSDPHPAHTDNTELNVGAIAPGQTQSVTLNTKGTWGYHNHLNPSDKGKVIVE